jgi:hypothetical protein
LIEKKTFLEWGFLIFGDITVAHQNSGGAAVNYERSG